MGWNWNILDTIRERFGSTAPTGEIMRQTPLLDSFRDYVSDTQTFANYKALIRSGDNGDLAQTLKLFEEIEEKDYRLSVAAEKRRMAFTGLEWDIVSAADQEESEGDRKLADDAAAYVRETLSNLMGFDEALEHLAMAVGSNLAVVELVWSNKNELRKITLIPSHRLRSDPQNPGVRIITQENRMGVEALPGQFIVHIPKNRCGFPFKGAIHRALTVLFLVKFAALADWAQFCQTFGMPVRMGRYQKNASAAEKAEALTMLKNMGSHAYALVSQAFSLEFKESSQRGVSPHEALVNFCDRNQTIAFTGGHLTTDTTGATGTHAAGAAQHEVQQDLRDDDIRREGRSLRDQLIAPMCYFAFGRDDVPVPYLVRRVPEIKDRLQEANVMQQAVNLGLAIEKSYAYQTLELPEPELDEQGNPVNPVIEKQAPPDPFGQEGTGPAFDEDEL